jgi:hypothetical protein
MKKTPEERLRGRLGKAGRLLMVSFIVFCISFAILSLLKDFTDKSNDYFFVGELTGLVLVAVATALDTKEEE